jgi:hypothetical protein
MALLVSACSSASSSPLVLAIRCLPVEEEVVQQCCSTGAFGTHSQPAMLVPQSLRVKPRRSRSHRDVHCLLQALRAFPVSQGHQRIARCSTGEQNLRWSDTTRHGRKYATRSTMYRLVFEC